MNPNSELEFPFFVHPFSRNSNPLRGSSSSGFQILSDFQTDQIRIRLSLCLLYTSSLLKAAELMLRHIGYAQKAEQLRRAVDSAASDPSLRMTGTREGSSTDDFTEAVLKALN